MPPMPPIRDDLHTSDVQKILTFILFYLPYLLTLNYKLITRKILITTGYFIFTNNLFEIKNESKLIRI